MPFVHTNLLRTTRAWQADTFFVYHTNYDAEAMAHPHRGGAVACAYNQTAIQLFEPKAVQVWQPIECDSKASIQYQQISRCFQMAKEHGEYDLYVRLRPDYAVIQHPVPLPAVPSTDPRPFCSAGKPDFAFVLTPVGLGAWEANAPRLSHCNGDCCLDYDPCATFGGWNPRPLPGVA